MNLNLDTAEKSHFHLENLSEVKLRASLGLTRMMSYGILGWMLSNEVDSE
jgi:hypothetical protein